MNPQPKIKPFRSKKAVEWFRTQECDACYNNGEGIVTGHHEPLKGRGMSSKGPDDEQIPLCFRCHRERHDIGRDKYFKNVDWEERVLYYQYFVQIYLGEIGLKNDRMRTKIKINWRSFI